MDYILYLAGLVVLIIGFTLVCCFLCFDYFMFGLGFACMLDG